MTNENMDFTGRFPPNIALGDQYVPDARDDQNAVGTYCNGRLW